MTRRVKWFWEVTRTTRLLNYNFEIHSRHPTKSTLSHTSLPSQLPLPLLQHVFFLQIALSRSKTEQDVFASKEIDEVDSQLSTSEHSPGS
jgi:hypothetical protein